MNNPIAQLYRLHSTTRVIQHDASRRGKKMLNDYRDKNEGTYRSGEGGEKGPPLYDPGSEFLPGGSARVMRGY